MATLSDFYTRLAAYASNEAGLEDPLVVRRKPTSSEADHARARRKQQKKSRKKNR